MSAPEQKSSLGSEPRLRISMQGGGMRTAYTVGVVEAVAHAGLSSRIASISTSSASAVAALGFFVDDLEAYGTTVLTQLASRRFINPRRVRRIADIDFLVDEVVAPLIERTRLDQPGFPELWFALTDGDSAITTHVRASRGNVLEALRATMAIPVLYGKRIEVGSQRYIDGGVTDPLPLLHAISLSRSVDVVCAVASKPIDQLASHDLGSVEKLAFMLDPRIRGVVRHTLLAPNPLIETTVAAFRDKQFGPTVVFTCEPSDPSLNFSRTNTNTDQLEQLRELGRADGRGMVEQMTSAQAQTH